MADPAATQWDEASREMRERAIEAARRCYPNPDAMMRAIAALRVAPSPMTREPATLLELPDGSLEIRRGERTARLSGATARTILAWYQHMEEHGRAWGETYLAGLTHGLAHAAEGKLRDVLDGLEASRARSAELARRIAEHKLSPEEDAIIREAARRAAREP